MFNEIGSFVITKRQFVSVDYNSNNSLLAMEKIRQLPFASQVKVFHTGFGMWKEDVPPILNS
jgi:hypothetical protein